MTQLMPAVNALLGAGFTVGVCLACGTLLFRGLRLEFHRLEHQLLAFVAGSACVSLAIFLLCLMHQARLPIFLVAGGSAMMWALLTEWKRPRRAILPAIPLAWALLFAVIFLLFFICYFSNALAPEISPDGSGYHLGNVARLWSHQGFAWDFHSLYSSLSQGMEMLFLVAFSIGRHPAAALVHFTFLSVLPWLMVCYGRRFGFPAVGVFGGLLVYACPVVGITGVSAYNDLAVATLLFAEFYLLQVDHEINNSKLLFLIGLLTGFSVAVKYTAGLIVPLVVVSTRGKKVVALAGGAALMAGPWIIRNWVWLGNPAAPFMNSWFPNPYWTAGAEHQYLAGLRQYPPFESYGDFVLQLTVLGGLVPGLLGPAMLLLPLGLLALRHPRGRSLLLAGAVVAVPALLNTEMRFLIPALPFFALALGLAMQNSWGALPAVALLQTVLCWPTVLSTYCEPNAWRVRGFQFQAALHSESETHFIADHVGDFALRPAIEQNVPADGRLFSFAGRAAGYMDRDVIVGYESTFGTQIQQGLQAAAATRSGQSDATLRARTAGVRFLLINDSDGVANDIKRNLNNWGLTKLAEANGTTLYRID